MKLEIQHVRTPEGSDHVRHAYLIYTRNLNEKTGGSAASFLRKRHPFRGLALHVNTSALAAIGNDYGYEHVFARELTADARPDGVLLAISTSDQASEHSGRDRGNSAVQGWRHRPNG